MINKTKKLNLPKPPRAYARTFARLDEALTKPDTASEVKTPETLNQAYRRIFGMALEKEPQSHES